MKGKAKDIGYDVKIPEKVCKDRNCPFHGVLPIRGKILEGIVTSLRMDKTVIIERDYLRYVPKYERYERRKSKIAAHKPDCFLLKKGDKVKIAECRPLSKTKHFVIIEKM